MALNQTAISDLVIHVGVDDMKMQRDLTSMGRMIRSSTNAWKAEFTSLEASGRHFDAVKTKMEGLTNTTTMSREKIKALRLEYDNLDKSEEKNAGKIAKLTSQINTETRKLAAQEEQLKRVTEQYRVEEQGIEKVSREYRMMDSSLNATVKTQELYGNKLTASRTKMLGLQQQVERLNSMYKIEKGRLNDVATQYGTNNRMYEEQGKKVVGLRSKLDEYQHTIVETSKKVGGATQADTLKYDKLTRSASKLTATGQKWRNTGQSMYGVTMSLGAGFLYSATQAAKLENSYRMTNNLLVTGGEKQAQVTKNVTEMQKEGEAYSLKYGKSMTSIATGYQELVKRGYTSEQALGSMKSMLQASVASGDDFNDVVKISTATLESFGMRTNSVSGMMKNTKEVTNKLAYAADMTATSFKDIGVAMQYAGPSAHSAGVSLGETASMLGVLSNNGLEAQVAGTGVRKVFNSLISPTDTAKGIMDKYGISIKDSSGHMKTMTDVFGQMNDKFKGLSKTEKVDIFHKMFGTTGQNAALLLAEHSKEIGEITEKVDKAPKNNYIESLSAKNMKSAQNQLAIFKQSATALGVELSKNVLPPITHITQALVPMVRKLGDASDNTKAWVAGGLAVAALAGPVLAVAGNIITLVGAMKTARAWYVKTNGQTRQSTKYRLENAAAIAAENDALSAQSKISTGTPVNSKTGVGGVTEPTVSNGAKSTGIIARSKASWGNMGLFDKANVAIAGLEIGTSVWGAISAKSKEERNQKIWESAGGLVGAGIGGVVGGPEGAMWGATIGNAITKNIKIKDIPKDLKSKAPNSDKKFSLKPDWSNLNPNTMAPGGLNNIYPTKIPKKVDPLKGLSASAKKETKQAAADLNKLYKTYGTLDKASYKSMISLSDKRVSAANSESKKRLNLMVKEGLITKQQADQMYKADQKNNSKRYGGLKNNLTKLEKLNDQYYKKGTISQKNYEKQKQKIIKDMAKQELNAISKNGKEREKIEKYLSDHRKKLSLNEANSIKKNADNEYKYTVNAAKKKRDESIDAARSQYNKVVAEANKQYKQNKTISYAEYQAILANAKQKKSDSEAEAWKQYQAVLKQAKAQHTDVVAEIQGEVTDSMNAQSALSRWYAKHNIFKGIAQDADHAFERITNVKNGMATIADANAQADAVKRKQDSIKVGQATGRTTDLGPIGKDNMAGVFGGHAAGGPITKTQISLVGEQGPELAYDPKTGKARLLGIKGAQVTTVRAGEHILTANETKKAMNGGVGTTLKGFAGGAGGGITMGLLGGGDSETVDGKKKRKDLNSDKDLKNSEKDLKKFQKNSKSIWKKTESDTEKKLKDQNKTVNKFYSKLTDDSDKHLKDTQDNNKDRWSQMYDDTKHYNKSIHDYATKEQDKLRKDIGKNTNRIYSTWKNDWRITSGAFNSEFKKLRPYSKNGMNGAITSLNQGVSNINRLVSAFGGNSAILPQVSHYATGTNGRIASDELAMVNDALGSNWKEIVELPSGGMIEATQRNAVMPLPAGSRVFNGEQSKRLKEQGIVTAHHATGTMSSEEVDKIVKSKLKSPQASWNTDFESKVTSGIGTRLQQSLTSNNKGSSNKAGVPWYKALWNVISDLMGTAAGGPWLHSPGSGWVHTDSFGSSRGGGRVHDGNDFSSGQGAIIHAMHGGEVIYAGGPPAGWGPIGYNIITKGRDGQYVIYQEFGNAGNSRVSVGDKVKTGQAIATLGHSGLGTGPHVHVGASKNHPHHNGGYTTSGWEDITKMTGGDDGTDEKPKTADDKRLEALVKKELGKKAISYITSNWGSEVTGGSYKGGYSVDMIKKAAKAMHTSISGEKLHQLQLLIKNESGGNPGITGINDGDGSGPAMGLLQYKRGTFMNYAMPGHHNIKSAYDQLLAFFNDSNWYSDIGMGYNGKYGEWRGLASGPSGHRRYANGGIVNQHQMAEIAEGNLPEAIVPMDDSKRNRGYEVLGKTVSAFANDLQDASKNGVATKDDINTLAGLLSDTNKLLKSVVQAVYDTAVTRKGLANIVSSENKLNKIKKNRSLGLGG